MKNLRFLNTITAILSLGLCTTFVHSTNYTAATASQITSGFTQLQAGDTLRIAPGVYYFSDKISLGATHSGTAANNRVAIMAQDLADRPVFDFSGQTYDSSNRGFSLGANYVHLKGIVIRYAGDNGLYSEGSYNVIEYCESYGNADSGFQLKNGCGNLILNCDSHHNFDYVSSGGNADGFADKQYTNNGEPNIYDGCRAWSNSDDGWDFYQKVGTTIIRNSICYDSAPASYDMTAHPRRTESYFNGKNLSAVTHTGNGNGFKLGGDYTNHTVTVTNCLAVANKVRGYDQNNNAGTMTVYNCSALGNRPDYGFNNNQYGALTIKNCLTWQSKATNELNSKTVTQSYNSWNAATGVTCNADDFMSLDISVIASPRQANGDLPVLALMRLVEGSDLIDAGTEVGLPFSGAAPDLGCYETGGNLQYPGTVSQPANRTQTVMEGNDIEPVVFTWGGSAEGLTITDLPEGLRFDIDLTAQTLTISGAPTEKGAFDYTVSTVGGVGAVSNSSGKFTVGSATAKKIAYITTPNDERDALILAKLNANPDFLVTIENAANVNDYSGYDLIVLSAVPGSNSAGLSSVEALNKPKLVLKPFQLQNTRWNWTSVAAVNTQQTTVTIQDKTHEIFEGLTFTGTGNDELQLFSSSTTNAVTGITSWIGNPAVDLLGVAKGTSTQSIVEIPIGTNMNGTTVNSRFLMIGVSEYSYANLTATATQLIENSCYYLLGISIGSGIDSPTGDHLQLRIANGLLSLSEPADISLYAVSGRLLKAAARTQEISVADLPQGVYIVRAKAASGEVLTSKFVK